MKQSKMKFNAKRDEDNPLVPGHRYLFNWVKPYIKNSKILDIGCWTGPMEQLFEKEKCIVTGMDIEEEPLVYARKRFPKFKFVRGSIVEKTSLRNNQFDLVLYFMVLEHIPKGTEELSFIQINRLMKKGGRLFFNTMNRTYVWDFLDPAYFFGHRHYTRKELVRLLEKTGFKIEKITYNAGFFTTFHIFMLYFSKHILKRREPRNRFFDWLMEQDYKDRGFIEIDIQAKKIKSV